MAVAVCPGVLRGLEEKIMRSIILILPSRNEISCLYEQWRDKAKNIFKTCNRFNMAIDGERIYMNYYGGHYYNKQEEK